ncbi:MULTISPECIES: DUF4870 domain-containing protein [Oxalobacteraceae]|jgi:hypothetical protein|uniref:DUF4870 domain-containing protein n=1 Tax=Oxalobacteraceae TaxID=75682 RepID=UPI0010A336CA|nr:MULTISPECIES: DUF4870 domain-containing protein [Oxalobacteraceae]HJV83258.1 DUF4870 domain-containing protein [Noviherbaspirillum sp.]
MNEMIESSPSKDECNLAMLAHLLGVFTGFVGALVLWLVKRDEAGFVAQEAREALNFQITVAIALAASVMLKLILIGFLLFPLIFLANFIFSILGAVSAAKGKHYRYPIALRLVS